MTTSRLPLDGLPRRLFTGSPTKLTTWLDCPARYRLTYVDKAPKGPPWAHNSVGNSIHNALRDWYLLPVAERTTGAVAGIVRRDWITAGFRDEEQSREWCERAVAWVVLYVATLDPNDEPAGVERSVAFRTQTLALNGRADRIDARTDEDGRDELVVVDYKTGRHLLSTADVRSSLALAVYAVAAARTLRRPCRRVELHHLPSGQVLSWEHDDASLNRHIARAHDIAAEAGRAVELARARREEDEEADVADLFPARPGPACGYCDMVRDCEAGIAETQAVLRAPWDGLMRWNVEERRVPGS
jgi:hypothetical protein